MHRACRPAFSWPQMGVFPPPHLPTGENSLADERPHALPVNIRTGPTIVKARRSFLWYRAVPSPGRAVAHGNPGRLQAIARGECSGDFRGMHDAILGGAIVALQRGEDFRVKRARFRF